MNCYPSKFFHISTLTFRVLVAICAFAFTSETISAQTEEWTLADTAQAKNLLKEGIALTQEGKLDEAFDKLHQAKEIYLQTIGEKTKEVATIFDQMGQVLAGKKNFDESIILFEKALNIRREIFGEGNMQVLISLNNLALTLNMIGDYTKAGEYYEMLLKLILENYGEDNKNTPLAYSNLGVNYNKRGEFKKSIECDSSALRLRIKLFGENSLEVAQSYNNLGVNFDDIGEYDKAIEVHNKALAIRLDKLGNLHQHVGYSYTGLGNCYMKKGDYKQQLNYQLKAFEIYKVLYGTESEEIISSYHNIGLAYYFLGDYERAISYLSNALLLLKKYYGEKHDDVALALSSIGSCYSELGDYQKAKEFQTKSLKVRLEMFGESHHSVADSYENLGNNALNRKEYEEAITFHQKSLELRKTLLGEEHPSVASSKFNIGVVYEEKGDLDIAQEYYQAALKGYLYKFGNIHPDVAKTYRTLASVAMKRKSFVEAEKLQSSSIAALTYQDGSLLTSVSSIPSLLQTQNAQINLYNQEYEDTKNISYLHSSERVSQEAFEAIEYQSGLSSSKLNLLESIQPIYEGALTTNHSFYTLTGSSENLEEAFSVAERAKAQLIFSAMKDASALAFSNIPDSLLQKEYNLRIDIAYQDQRRKEKLDAGLSETDTTVLSIRNKIFEIKQEFESLKKRFELEFPDYHRLKYDLTTIPLEEVQNTLLTPGQALLEYFTGDSSIFIFVVRKGEAPHLVEVKKDFPLEEWVKKFREALSRPGMVDQYADYAVRLYEKLVSPVAEWLPERVVVVPDGVLGYVPFGALLTGEPEDRASYQAFDFLVEHHQFSYCYSATLLKEMVQKQHRQAPEKAFAAFAPAYDGDTTLFASRHAHDPELRLGLSPLPNSIKEVETASGRMGGGDLFLGGTALLGTFREVAHLYRILHLSMHGRADNRVGDYAFLAFAQQRETGDDGLLYVRDLYNLQLNADLVVLSACETGTGKLRRGEGIISLARAFAYAGAKGIVTTLWSVNDAKTSEVMDVFYRELAAGSDKDAALCTAQLEYINREGANNKDLHPYFWAAFLPVGDMAGMRR